jgi:hypothetical protein
MIKTKLPIQSEGRYAGKGASTYYYTAEDRKLILDLIHYLERKPDQLRAVVSLSDAIRYALRVEKESRSRARKVA